MEKLSEKKFQDLVYICYAQSKNGEAYKNVVQQMRDDWYPLFYLEDRFTQAQEHHRYLEKENKGDFNWLNSFYRLKKPDQITAFYDELEPDQKEIVDAILGGKNVISFIRELIDEKKN